MMRTMQEIYAELPDDVTIGETDSSCVECRVARYWRPCADCGADMCFWCKRCKTCGGRRALSEFDCKEMDRCGARAGR